MTDRAFALRFISGKYQGGEYPLADAGELIIGRSTELDMVLIEDMVSRKHAKLTVAPGGITIADLGSTNGTFVNGEKVGRAQLKEGDRILIGTNILKLVAVTRQPGATVDNKAAQQSLERTAAAQEKRQGGRTAVQGRLEEVPLVDLLQLLSTSKKTGAVVIKGYRGGRIHLRSGKVVSAAIDADPTLPAKKALYRMVTWGQGGFEFAPQEELAPMPGEIAESTDRLIMEAIQQAEEMSSGTLPAPTAAVGIAMPLSPRLRELSPEELDLVQLVHNYGVVQAVLDRAAGPDLEVARALRSLIDRGYLRQF